MQKPEPKTTWAISSSAFQRLLKWLDEGKDSNGQNYLEMRQRLVAYFDRKNCLTPDEFADETLNRVARRLEEEKTIEIDTPAKYCYITARFVFLEYLRRADIENVPLDDILHHKVDPGNRFVATLQEEENETKEKMLDCLERCVRELDVLTRDIINGYYAGTERIKIDNRRALAKKLGVTVNALSIRTCRIRGKLEVCVGKCLGGS